MSHRNVNPEEVLRVHRNLFTITFALLCVLIIFVLSFSIISKDHTSRILAFDVAAERIHLDFEQVGMSLNNFYDELAEAEPSLPYIETLQADLGGKLARLEESMGQLSAEVEVVSARSEELLRDVTPRLEAFIERAQRFVNADFETLKTRYARPTMVDLAATRSSSVGQALEEISKEARGQQASNIDRFHQFIVAAILLSLLLLLFVWYWVIRPALARQKEAISREIEFSADLARKNAALKQAESKALVLYEDARRGLRARAEFLGVVSHELRTPLNAVIGFSDILKNELFGKHAVPAYRDYANDIHKSGQHLLDIVGDILEFTRFESEKVVLSNENVDIDDLFADVRMLLADKASESLKFYNRAIEGQTLRIDRRFVTQAMINIIDNAIKFSPENCSIQINAVAAPDGGFAIRVADCGIGIDRESIPRLLRPFEQLESAFSRTAGGLGLGLAISNKIMQAHDGEIDIDSTPGQGSCVSLIFPAKRLLSAEEPESRALDESNGGTG